MIRQYADAHGAFGAPGFGDAAPDGGARVQHDVALDHGMRGVQAAKLLFVAPIPRAPHHQRDHPQSSMMDMFYVVSERGAAAVAEHMAGQ